MTPTPARVGIVVRTKNRPWFLRRTLADIVAQEYSDWWMHVVDDGGDAEAVDAAIAELAEDARARIVVTHNEVARGRSAAANQGLLALDTEFVVLHDDDDLWHPAFLAETVTWLDEHPDDAGVVARTEIVYEQSAGDGFAPVDRAVFWPELEEITFVDLIEVNRFVPISFLYRRGLHDDVGLYDEDVHAAEDWEFNLRATVAHHVGFLDGPPLAFWMQRIGVTGDQGNSMFALAAEHARYDKLIRDAALRRYVAEHGAGLPLYLSRLMRDEVTRIVRDEVARALDARPSDLDRVRGRLRRWRRQRH